MGEAMRIFILTRSRFPSERAESMTTIYTAEVLAQKGCLVEVFFRSERTFLEPLVRSYVANPFSFYGINLSLVEKGLLKIRFVPSLSFISKLSHYMNNKFSKIFLEKMYWFTYNLLVLIYVCIESLLNKPDIICTRTTSIAYLLLLLKPLIKTPIVFEVHSLSKIPPTPRERAVLQKADGIIVVTKTLRDMLLKLGIDPKKICYAITGAKASFLEQATQSKHQLRTKLGLPNDDLIIIYVGSLYKRKGVEDLIYAMKIIKEKKPSIYSKTRLLIIGGNLVEPEFYRIKGIIKELHLEKHIIVHRFIPPHKVFDYILASDIAAYTPRRTFYQEYLGAGGLKLWQYMLAAKPIILSRLKSIEEITTDRENALLVEPEKPEAIADAIIELATNREFAEYLGKKAQQTVLNQYTWEHRAQRILQFFKDITSRN